MSKIIKTKAFPLKYLKDNCAIKNTFLVIQNTDLLPNSTKWLVYPILRQFIMGFPSFLLVNDQSMTNS